MAFGSIPAAHILSLCDAETLLRGETGEPERYIAHCPGQQSRADDFKAVPNGRTLRVSMQGYTIRRFATFWSSASNPTPGVGIIDSQGCRVTTFGKLDRDYPRDVKGDTVSE